METMNRRVVVPGIVAALAAVGAATLYLLADGTGSFGHSGLQASAPPSASIHTGLSTVKPGSPIPGAPTSTPVPGIVLGAYIPGAPSDPSRIDAFATLTGGMPRIVMWYQMWAGPYNAFYAAGADAIRARGATPMISWEPLDSYNDVDPAWSLETIIDGDHDPLIHEWTHDVAAWGQPLYVRVMHEMNGWWTPWSPGVNGNTEPEFVAAWRHVIDIARAEGASNIRWIWCPNIDDGNPNLTPYDRLYPGDEYVDWVGLTGYNWGASQQWSKWIDMRSTFEDSIAQIRAITAKPLMIAEMGSEEQGGDKGAWIAEGFSRLEKGLPDVKAVVWFDAFDARLGTHWEVDSSAGSLAAFSAVMASPRFAGTLP